MRDILNPLDRFIYACVIVQRMPHLGNLPIDLESTDHKH
jgi:hypothetical protein